jgi:hypothetical protein
MTTIAFDKMTFAQKVEWLKQQDEGKIDPTEEECWDEVLKGNITEDDFKDMIYEMSAHKINYYETPHKHKRPSRKNYNLNTCVELRNFISEWNKATPDKREKCKYLMPIKGIYKMKKAELVKIAEEIFGN